LRQEITRVCDGSGLWHLGFLYQKIIDFLKGKGAVSYSQCGAGWQGRHHSISTIMLGFDLAYSDILCSTLTYEQNWDGI